MAKHSRMTLIVQSEKNGDACCGARSRGYRGMPPAPSSESWPSPMFLLLSFALHSWAAYMGCDPASLGWLCPRPGKPRKAY